MRHYMKYRLKIMLGDKSTVFWSMLFPLIMVTLFRFTIAQIGKTETMEPVEAGAVMVQEDMGFREFLKGMEGDLIHLTIYESREQGEKALEDKKVNGVFLLGDERSLSVISTGMKESILEGLLDSYEKNEAVLKEIAANHPENLETVIEAMADYQPMVQEVGLGGKSLDTAMQYFFAALAMACVYGSFLGLQSAFELKANITPLGARKCVSPAKRLSMIFSDMTVMIGVHFTYIVLLLFYMRFLLGVQLTDNWPKVLLVCFFGCVFGISAGILVGSSGKLRESAKLGILIGGSLTLCFLAGLMYTGVKSAVEHACPILNRLNPVALITDGFYSINVYDDPVRFVSNLGILAAMALGCLSLSFLAVRRERYDSI